MIIKVSLKKSPKRNLQQFSIPADLFARIALSLFLLSLASRIFPMMVPIQPKKNFDFLTKQIKLSFLLDRFNECN